MKRSLWPAAAVSAAMALPSGPLAAQLTDVKSWGYVGRIEWTDYIKGPNDFSRETVVAIVTPDVDFVPLTRDVDALAFRFKVSCSVHYQDTEQDLTADGPGLFELKWGPARTNPRQSTYEFILACPNAMYTPPVEARWSHTMESTPQKGGMGQWPGGRVYPDMLEGTWSIPSPDTDDLNGVSGTKSLTWRLCRLTSPGCKAPKPLKPPSPEASGPSLAEAAGGPVESRDQAASLAPGPDHPSAAVATTPESLAPQDHRRAVDRRRRGPVARASAAGPPGAAGGGGETGRHSGAGDRDPLVRDG